MDMDTALALRSAHVDHITITAPRRTPARIKSRTDRSGISFCILVSIGLGISTWMWSQVIDNPEPIIDRPYAYFLPAAPTLP